MAISLIQDRLASYHATSKQAELCALKEIYQEIALAGLARGQFFRVAAFQGGTALRIVHQLNRFSEDLDFVLLKQDPGFRWHDFVRAVELEFKAFGVSLEVKERYQAKGPIKTAFLKEDSFARVLELSYARVRSDARTIQIKLEVDTNPPAESTYETTFLAYPYPFSILIQDIPSLFANKCHALLCRPYEKGRDWFDLLWYLRRKAEPNMPLLKAALQQAGPFQNRILEISQTWLKEAMREKILALDWDKARRDIENFLSLEDRRFVANWNREFFLSQIEQL